MRHGLQYGQERGKYIILFFSSDVDAVAKASNVRSRKVLTDTDTVIYSVTVALGFIGIVLHIVGMSTSAWTVAKDSSDDTLYKFGPWRVCEAGGDCGGWDQFSCEF